MTRKSLGVSGAPLPGFWPECRHGKPRACQQGSREKIVFPNSHTRYPINHSPRSCNLGTRKTRVSLHGLDLLLSVLAAREVHDMLCTMVNH